MLLWVLAEGIPAAAYMDDWATPHPTRTGALAQIDALETIITRPGFRFNAAKRKCSQRVVHLRLLIDTVDMPLGFDRSNSSVTKRVPAYPDGGSEHLARLGSSHGRQAWLARTGSPSRSHSHPRVVALRLLRQ